MMILFENGKSAVIEVNWITPLKVRKLSLTCDKAFAELDYIDQSISVSSSKFIEPEEKSQYPARIEFETRSLPVTKSEPLKLEIEDFVAAINGQKEVGVSGRDGLLALKVARAAEESLATGMVIAIE
jgi:UDP-N-acetylglucosamine 3-dehydrogenase